MWSNQAPELILASASPRRVEILSQLKIPCIQLILPAQNADEPRNHHESVLQYVTRTSQEKNRRAQSLIQSSRPDLGGLPILSADTTVAIGETIFGKPHDSQHAKEILLSLSGEVHDVYCAVTLTFEEKTLNALSHSQVTFDACLSLEMDDYVRTGEPFGKAGAYGIQGLAASCISHLSGSYSGVMGLPIFETCQLLRQAGLWR